jgi:DNA-directed RNA polymerase subunit RPC12/RpoP
MLGEAFWRVMCTLLEWLPWRPVKFKCCDCGQTYYFTVDIIIADSMDTDGHPHPVIECPHCFLRHQVLIFNFMPNAGWEFRWLKKNTPQC